ncbi:MAG: murein transglycosylase A [Alphaproteobacteria bacterium]
MFRLPAMWVALALPVLGCAETGDKPEPDKAVVSAVSFSDLPGWGADNHAGALGALLKSCAPMERRGIPAFGDASVWQDICRRARSVSANDHAGARAFFENNFYPAAVSGRDGPTGLITGYYEPELRGARKRSARFNVPLHVRPPDLVTVSLGQFSDDLKGKKIAGRVVQGRLLPYPDRRKIQRGALKNRNLELVWVDSAADAFFLHIQGSGRILLRDGSIMRVGYAGTNGHPYTAIGRELIARGAVPPEQMSMQTIRAWLTANPADGARLMQTNKSYVFFRELTGDGPLGAQGVALTPERSLAVDRRLLPLGLPVWLETAEPDGSPFKRLMIAQDTGGAIRGAVRADVFWGPGAKAADRAGKMKSPGRYWFLIPRAARPAS